jgi:hypothetical protein
MSGFCESGIPDENAGLKYPANMRSLYSFGSMTMLLIVLFGMSIVLPVFWKASSCVLFC